MGAQVLVKPSARRLPRLGCFRQQTDDPGVTDVMNLSKPRAFESYKNRQMQQMNPSDINTTAETGIPIIHANVTNTRSLSIQFLKGCSSKEPRGVKKRRIRRQRDRNVEKVDRKYESFVSAVSTDVRDRHGNLMCCHNKRAYYCALCKGGGMCIHSRQRAQCRDCNGTRKRKRRKCTQDEV